jgi:hypothetical protein
MCKKLSLIKTTAKTGKLFPNPVSSIAEMMQKNFGMALSYGAILRLRSSYNPKNTGAPGSRLSRASRFRSYHPCGGNLSKCSSMWV